MLNWLNTSPILPFLKNNIFCRAYTIDSDENSFDEDEEDNMLDMYMLWQSG